MQAPLRELPPSPRRFRQSLAAHRPPAWCTPRTMPPVPGCRAYSRMWPSSEVGMRAFATVVAIEVLPPFQRAHARPPRVTLAAERGSLLFFLLFRTVQHPQLSSDLALRRGSLHIPVIEKKTKLEARKARGAAKTLTLQPKLPQSWTRRSVRGWRTLCLSGAAPWGRC